MAHMIKITSASRDAVDAIKIENLAGLGMITAGVWRSFFGAHHLAGGVMLRMPASAHSFFQLAHADIAVEPASVQLSRDRPLRECLPREMKPSLFTSVLRDG